MSMNQIENLIYNQVLRKTMGFVKKIGGMLISIKPFRSRQSGMLLGVVVDNEWWFSRKA
jgi:hypothetical protein